MKLQFIPLCMVFLFAQRFYAQDNEELKMVLDGLRVELVQAGTVSTNDFEFGTSISPDEKELFFVKGITGFRRTVLVYCRWKDGKWSEPKIAPFSGKYRDTNPYHSKDGKRLYFTSVRPSPKASLKKSNLWYVEKTPDGWSAPEIVGGYPNDEFEIVYPTIHADGTVYFTSWTRPGAQKGDIFVSTLNKGRYTAPKRVDELNTNQNDADPEMTPDSNYMFIASMRLGGLGHYDLYIFKKQRDGKWGKGINLGPKINSIDMDSDPIFAPDGKTLYFSSNRLDTVDPDSNAITDYRALVKSHKKIHNGLMNIYKVDISVLLAYLNK